MRSIVAICGSASPDSANLKLLQAIQKEFESTYSISVLNGLWNLPLYTPQTEENGVPESVKELRKAVTTADAVIISTPEYLHNIPAVLKNALEWMTNSGELAEKPVLPITFTPAPPRGEHAMRSLLPSLMASKAKVVAELPLFQNELRSESGMIELNDEHRSLISEALSLL